MNKNNIFLLQVDFKKIKVKIEKYLKKQKVNLFNKNNRQMNLITLIQNLMKLNKVYQAKNL